MSFSNKFKELEEETLYPESQQQVQQQQYQENPRRGGPVIGNRFQAQREQEGKQEAAAIYRPKEPASQSVR